MFFKTYTPLFLSHYKLKSIGIPKVFLVHFLKMGGCHRLNKFYLIRLRFYSEPDSSRSKPQNISYVYSLLEIDHSGLIQKHKNLKEILFHLTKIWENLLFLSISLFAYHKIPGEK